MSKLLLFALIGCCLPILAQKPKQAAAGEFYGVIPHVVDGGSWSTEIILVNLDTIASKYKFDLKNDAGQETQFSFEGRAPAASYSGQIEGNAVLRFATTGAGALKSGWAQLDILNTDEVAIMAIFRQRVAGRPDFEATVIGASNSEYDSVFAFDNTEGFATGIAILNPSSFSNYTPTVEIRDDAGRLLKTEQLTLPRGSKLVFVVADRYPEAAGKRGTIHFPRNFMSLSVLGFRFSPGGAFTTIPLMER